MIVGVIGSGAIGPDLAYGFVSALARKAGSKVYLVDIHQDALEAGMARIQGYVKKGVARGKLHPKAAKTIQDALIPTMDLKDLSDCDYVLEAASEDLPVKQAILKNLEDVVRADCLIGFATSGLPRVQIAANARHPDRCFVNHPFFPAWRSLPIEVVPSHDEALSAQMVQTLKTLGKVPILTGDVACFAADDIFCNYISEAARIVQEGLATPAQVDTIVNEAIGGGGPFNVMDGTRGNLLTAHCQTLMQEAPTGSDWFAAPTILTEQGNKPWHDRKNPGSTVHSESLRTQVLDRILAVLLSRTYFVVDNGICDASDLNWMTRMALGFKDGLLTLAEKLGAGRVHAICKAYVQDNPVFTIPESIAAETLVPFTANIKVSRDSDIAVISVHRPEVKNALSKDTVAEIDAAFAALAKDDEIAGIVFTSYDGALAGADITELAALETPDDARNICLRAYKVLDRIATMNKPVVAALNGPVLGGGSEFAMACHARVVGPGTIAGQPEVNLGIVPGYGGTQRLPRLVGIERGLELLRTGRPFSAEEACAWGWATGEPVADHIGAAKALIRQHLEGKTKIGPVSSEPMQLPDVFPEVDLGHHSLATDEILMDVVREGLSKSLSEGLKVEADGFARCKGTVDLHIGLTNFIQNGPRVPAAFLNE